jgi:hypothetical protein
MATDGSGTQDRLEGEVRQVVAFVERMTGLRSRWNGTVRVVDAATAALLSPVPFLAKKEWGCGITLLDTTMAAGGRYSTRRSTRSRSV